VVVCGSLLLHLRDPLRALEAIRSVCTGSFLSSDEVRLGLSFLHPRRALAELDGSGERVQWWVPNAAGHQRMLFAAGFEIGQTTKPFAVRFGKSHPTSHAGAREKLRHLRRRTLQRLLAGGVGVPHCAVLATPRV
jgi:tRNA (mo5U34)-methyltransferase